jgi:hypothetical protein
VTSRGGIGEKNHPPARAGGSLDTETLKRHVARSGFGALTSESTQAAFYGAPFLAPERRISPTHGPEWSQAFETLTRMSCVGKRRDVR